VEGGEGESHKSTWSLGEAVREGEEGRTGGNCEEERDMDQEKEYNEEQEIV
jgi:hypothetical protein